MEKRIILAVTHGAKFNGKNPGMTLLGFAQIKSLRDFIPVAPSAIKVGVGKRHINVLDALACRGIATYSSVCGDSDSLEMIAGQPMVILADGTPVPLAQHTSIADMAFASKLVVINMPDNSLICTGRPFVKAIGFDDAKSAAVYEIVVQDGCIAAVNEIAIAPKDFQV